MPVAGVTGDEAPGKLGPVEAAFDVVIIEEIINVIIIDEIEGDGRGVEQNRAEGQPQADQNLANVFSGNHTMRLADADTL